MPATSVNMCPASARSARLLEARPPRQPQYEDRHGDREDDSSRRRPAAAGLWVWGIRSIVRGLSGPVTDAVRRSGQWGGCTGSEGLAGRLVERVGVSAEPHGHVPQLPPIRRGQARGGDPVERPGSSIQEDPAGRRPGLGRRGQPEDRVHALGGGSQEPPHELAEAGQRRLEAGRVGPARVHRVDDGSAPGAAGGPTRGRGRPGRAWPGRRRAGLVGAVAEPEVVEGQALRVHAARRDRDDPAVRTCRQPRQ